MRKIVHIDADSFYASVEVRDNPSLKNLPVAVGGSPKGRGVIATCSYEARRYGVRSAMASAQALRLCPNLVFIKPRFDAYKRVSKQMHQIFREYTDLIEPLSLDEAYLDVSKSAACQGSATQIAQEIRGKVKSLLNITVSAGVAPNKFLAKVASDWNKPDGIYVVKPSSVGEFVSQLPVGKINGVGKVTTKKMQQLGVQTCSDLQQLDRLTLGKYFGSYGQRLYDLARGRDDREVVTHRIRKSLSTEHTYEQDLPDLTSILLHCAPLFDELNERFTKVEHQYLVTKRFVKVKFADFTQTTLEESLPSPLDWSDYEKYTQLIQNAWKRQCKPVRLLGMGVRLQPNKVETAGVQLPLFS